MSEEETVVPLENSGAFVASLKRTNKSIKADRADAIGEDAEMAFRRSIEDMQVEAKRMVRAQTNMLDMSPENSYSLMLGKDFDSAKFVEEDAKLGLDMRNLNIKLEIAKARYRILFGEL